jgi:hypothetical protein
MSIQFASDVQSLTFDKVADYLCNSNLFKNNLRDYPNQAKFDLLYGSTLIEVEVLPWEIHPWEKANLATVRATSCVTIGSRIDQELLHFLLTENRRMRFGAFHLDEADQVLFAESVLGGENMDLMELQTCILSVVTIADTYDDIIAERFGGKRAVELLGTGNIKDG